MIRRVFTGHEIAEGAIIPRWYGIAYRHPLVDRAVCYPIPLNLVIGWARLLWWALKRGPEPSWRDRYLATLRHVSVLAMQAQEDREDALRWRRMEQRLADAISPAAPCTPPPRDGPPR